MINDNDPVSCVRNKRPTDGTPAAPNWAEQVVKEIEAMDIEILRFTDGDFDARMSEGLEETQRKRINQLLTAFGMVAFAISKDRLWDLGCTLGDRIGRWIHKDANVAALALEARFGYRPQLASARGKIVLLAIEKKLSANQLIQYVHDCGGLDKAVEHARIGLAPPSDISPSGEAEAKRNSEGSPCNADNEPTLLEAEAATTREEQQETPSPEHAEHGGEPQVDSGSKRHKRRKWPGLPGNENYALARVSRDTDWRNLPVELLTPKQALRVLGKALHFTATPGATRMRPPRPRSAIPPHILRRLHAIIRRARARRARREHL